MITLFGKGRGIEESRYRAADITIARNNNLKLDLGNGKVVELMNEGPAQSPADLFVWLPSSKVFWAGNPFIAESPTIPWLFDGFFLEPARNLRKVYDLLPDDAIIVPGHGKITNKAGIKYTIDYVDALKKNVEDAVRKGLHAGTNPSRRSPEGVRQRLCLFDWLHYNFNLPNAYRDIGSNQAK